jgi:hypothetical protein
MSSPVVRAVPLSGRLAQTATAVGEAPGPAHVAATAPASTNTATRGTRGITPLFYRLLPYGMPRAPVATLLLALLAGALAAAQAGNPPPLVVTGARLLDVAAGRYRPVAAIVVTERKVAAILDSAAPAPAGAETLDAAGLTVVPGLIDMWVQAVPSPAFDVDFFHALSLAHGVTTVRVVDARAEWLVSQRKRAPATGALTPRLSVAGAVLTPGSVGPAWWATGPSGPALIPPAALAASAADAAREAARQAGAGVDWIRLGPAVTAESARAVAGAVRRRQARVSAVPGTATAAELAAAGVALLDGVYGPFAGHHTAQGPDSGHEVPPVVEPDRAWAAMGAGERNALARKLAASRIAIAPMLRAIGRARGEAAKAELALLPERARKTLEQATAGATGPAAPPAAAMAARRAFVVAFSRAGGTLAAASGAGAGGWPVPGLGLHLELAELVAAGLSPLDAIRSATIAGAGVLGARQEGRLAVGARATFFIVEGDPLGDIRALQRVRHVVLDGEVLDRDALLRQATRAASGRIR